MRGLVLLALMPGMAHARELPARLTIERAAGAETCLSREQLEQRVESILHRRLTSADGSSIRVQFEHVPQGGFVARVSSAGPKPGQRLLRDAGPACDALGEAVSVAIALLLDNAEQEAEVSVPPPAVAPSTATPEVKEPSKPWHARLTLEAGAGYGLAARGGFGALGRIGIDQGHWQLELGAATTLSSGVAFEPGQVKTSLAFGMLRACYRLGRSFVLSPCALFAAGRLHGEGRGYARVQGASLPWTAAGLGLAAEIPLTGRLYASLGATLWVPTRRQTFSIENAGIAWKSTPVAGMLSAGLGFELL